MDRLERLLVDHLSTNPADVSPLFLSTSDYEAAVCQEMIRLAETPAAIRRFAQVCDGLGDYWYWFMLGSLWVSYTGYSDLGLWQALFRSDRPLRAACLMKPSELEEFARLPRWVTVYRAHRPGESDWIAYTRSPVIAARFARERGVQVVSEYRVRRDYITALFLRRGEHEVIMLDRTRARFVREVPVEG